MEIPINPDIEAYNQQLEEVELCNKLATLITRHLKHAESKIWHAHPVWFIEGNPIVGYSKQKKGIRLMFWSGAGFEEEKLTVRDGKFKDASVFYQSESEVNVTDLKRWLNKSIKIQWDYKNLVKRKGKLERLK